MAAGGHGNPPKQYFRQISETVMINNNIYIVWIWKTAGGPFDLRDLLGFIAKEVSSVPVLRVNKSVFLIRKHPFVRRK